MNKRALGRLVGVLAVLVSLGFLFLELRGGLTEISWQDLDGEFMVRWAAALALYLVGLTSVHVAWGLVVSRSSHRTGVLHPAVVSARAQIGKYLPGNVAHIAGRQVFAARQGWSQHSVVGASMLEIVGLVIAGVIIVAAGAAFGVRVQIDVSGWAWLLAAALAVIAIAGVGWLLWERQWARLRALATTAGSATPLIVGMYTFFLLLAGVGQWLLLEGAEPGTVVVAATGAWLVGFLSPGVPAGIGVREAVLAGTLSLQPMNLTLGLLGFRAVTVLSDLIVFLVGSVVAARIARGRARGSLERAEN